MKDAFYIINYSYFMCIAILLCLSTIFYPGSYQELQYSLANPYLGTLLSHIVVNTAVILFFLAFIFLASFFYRKWVSFSERYKCYKKAFLGLMALSVLLVVASHLMHTV